MPISYALHFPDRADVTVPRLDLADAGQLTFEPPDLDALPVPGAGARGGGRGRHRALRAERGRRGGGRGVPRRPAAVHGDRRGDRRGARAGRLGAARALRAAVRVRRARPRRSPSSWWRTSGSYDRELDPRLPRLRGPDRLPRGRALRGGEGRRHAGRALLPLLPAEALERHARRDRVRDRRDPARRLRAHHGHEPGGGARPPAEVGVRRAAVPRLREPAGLEADRGDRGGPVREPRDRVRDPLLPRVRRRRAHQRRRERAEGHAGRGDPRARRPAGRGRRRARRPRGAAVADRQPRVRGRAGRRLPGRDPGAGRRSSATARRSRSPAGPCTTPRPSGRCSGSPTERSRWTRGRPAPPTGRWTGCGT